MKNLILVFIFLLLAIIQFPLNANNIQVSNVAIVDVNPTLDYSIIQFDISWDNSWRTSVGPSNWDAAWVFVKYKKVGESTWMHAILNYVDGTGSGDGHTEPEGSNITSANDNAANGAHGVFIHRSADGSGTFSLTNVQLRWNYGVDGLTDTDMTDISVQAIEMVYVPSGSFYVGSTSTQWVEYGFFTDGSWLSGASIIPYHIISEDAIGIDNVAGKLWGTKQEGNSTIGNINEDGEATLPANFPKGYAGFYCMKYEITQEQYVAFLNKLTYGQQTNRIAFEPWRPAGYGPLNITDRNGIDISTSGNPQPAIFACNLDGDDNYNEPEDGQNIACNYLNWDDLASYLDWAALRPMTELEFEKACRGNQTPTHNEYAWGTDIIIRSTALNNTGTASETSSTSGANATGSAGVTRVGSFGQGVNTRTATGASYYGIMEMSGNVYETTISVGHNNGRAFTGKHGNGTLTNDGKFDTIDWPTTDVGVGVRGGAWTTDNLRYRISDRSFATTTYGRRAQFGGRGVRTAP